MHHQDVYHPDEKDKYDALHRELDDLFAVYGRNKKITRKDRLKKKPNQKHRNPGLVSESARKDRWDRARTFFNDLWRLGKKISHPKNIRSEHIKAACQFWCEKKLNPSTINQRLGTLDLMCEWLEKPGMVRRLKYYLSDTDLQALIDHHKKKKIVEVDIDVVDLIRRADARDKHFGLIMRMRLGFGMERVELLDNFQPWKSDSGDHLEIFRRRRIRIETSAQRAIVDLVKAVIPAGEALTWQQTDRGKELTKNYCEERYRDLANSLGLTKEVGDHLRRNPKEIAELIIQVIPPCLAKSGWAIPSNDFPPYVAPSAVMCPQGDAEADDVFRRKILEFLHRNQVSVMSQIPAERLEECVILMKELHLAEVDMTLPQGHYLWTCCSRQQGQAWMPLQEESNMAMIRQALDSLS